MKIEAPGSVEFWSHVWFLIDGGWLDSGGYLDISLESKYEIEKAATSGAHERVCCWVTLEYPEAKRIARATDNCLRTLNDWHQESWWERLALEPEGVAS